MHGRRHRLGMHAATILALSALATGCGRMVAIKYEATNPWKGQGAVTVVPFRYEAAEDHRVRPREVETNRVANTELYLSQEIGSFFTEAFRRELAHSGYRIEESSPRTVSGAITRFFVDWLEDEGSSNCTPCIRSGPLPKTGLLGSAPPSSEVPMRSRKTVCSFERVRRTACSGSFEPRRTRMSCSDNGTNGPSSNDGGQEGWWRRLDLYRTWSSQRSSMALNELAEKHGMRRWAPRIRIQCVVFLLAGCFTVACSTVESPPSAPLEPIPIADFNSVAGNWEGLMVQSPPARSRYDNWVHLKIQEDGTFHLKQSGPSGYSAVAVSLHSAAAPSRPGCTAFRSCRRTTPRTCDSSLRGRRGLRADRSRG